MRLNAKGTVGNFGGRKLINNKIITRNIQATPRPPHPHLSYTFDKRYHWYLYLLILQYTYIRIIV